MVTLEEMIATAYLVQIKGIDYKIVGYDSEQLTVIAEEECLLVVEANDLSKEHTYNYAQLVGLTEHTHWFKLEEVVIA